jgi:hypothetical protein
VGGSAPSMSERSWWHFGTWVKSAATSRFTVLPSCARRSDRRAQRLTTRAARKLLGRYVEVLSLDRNVAVHWLRVTVSCTARERRLDRVDLQEVVAHADLWTILIYV